MSIVTCGLDNLGKYDKLLSGKRLGLLTHPAAVNKDFVDSIEILHKNYNLTALFSPEHGVRGEKQAGLPVSTYVDNRTSITVFSIYGNESHEMTEQHTNEFDVLVYDVQDVGSRFYTFIANLKDCMKVCAKMGKPVVVLDRPNVIGDKIEGNVAHKDYFSLVCAHTMPQRYGLTVGEFAKMVNEEQNINCELHIIPMEGYKRNMPWEETGVKYITPSPNLPTVDGSFLYNGTCYFEGTTLSEGRGTTRPFEYVGAPWIDPFKLADVMNNHKFDGVKFQPVYFTPTFSKHKDEVCGGVRLHVTDRKSLLSVDVGLWLLYECKIMSEGHDFWRMNEKKGTYFIDTLGCSEDFRGNFNPEKMLSEWKAQCTEFTKQVEKFRIYK